MHPEINIVNMCNVDRFKIDLKVLPQGNTKFELELDDDFFEAIGSSDIQKGVLDCQLSVSRTDDFFELNFHIFGNVYILCDICLEEMEQSINAQNRLVVKFSETYSEEDELVTVDENEGILDVSWFIYEFIALQIPIKHVHAPGKCNHAMIEKLKQYTAARSGEESDKDVIDPRWAALMQLKK